MRSVVAPAVLLLACHSRSQPDAQITTKEQLGAALFNDPRLSQPPGQACADCHDASAAFADPEDERTSAGVIRERFGARNAQSVMYARFVPPLHRDAETGQMVGGLFWDGRVNTLEEQAAVPLLNPLEMNNPDKATVVAKAREHHGATFRRVFGNDVFVDTDRAFTAVTEAIAAFERTQAFAPFSSRYDRHVAGEPTLDAVELRGLEIFMDPRRGNCVRCHPPPLFSTFGYVNLGLPRFADNPFYALPADLDQLGAQTVDRGLGRVTGDRAHDGMFRVPSLRNVARTTPYGHNGYFRRLDEMVAFHLDTASVTAEPEVPATVSREHLGPLQVSRSELADVVAFLRTLSDASVRDRER